MSFLSCVLTNKVNAKLTERMSVSTWMGAVNMQVLRGSILASAVRAPLI